MRILYLTNMYPTVSNPASGIFVKEQIDFLEKEGINYDLFVIEGSKSKWNYITAISKLTAILKETDYDILHAHFGYSGIIALLSRWLSNIKILLIVTFHGSDILGKGTKRIPAMVCRKMVKFFDNVIVVCEEMKRFLPEIQNIITVPMGVNMDLFYPIDRQKARQKLSFNENNKILIFGGDPNNLVKNYNLAYAAFKMVKSKFSDTILIVLKDWERKSVPFLMNAVDVLLLTSFWEGSPMVVKEAMACNLPIVSTDVGDVKRNIEGLEGCYICSYEPEDVADKIMKALNFGRRTNGRRQLIKLGLTQEEVARKIIGVYRSVIK